MGPPCGFLDDACDPTHPQARLGASSIAIASGGASRNFGSNKPLQAMMALWFDP